MSLSVWEAVTVDSIGESRRSFVAASMGDALRRVAEMIFRTTDSVRVEFVRDLTPGGTITKWDLISETERAELDATPFRSASGSADGAGVGRCTFCTEELPTEGAFARHFTVPDVNRPNLGNCPRGPWYVL